jgi:hypothetical protein
LKEIGAETGYSDYMVCRVLALELRRLEALGDVEQSEDSL